jgi:hypothetical protein
MIALSILRSVAIALVVAAPRPALAENRGLPPVRYDRPYHGRVTTEVVADRTALRAICTSASRDPAVAACARRGSDGTTCHIMIVKRWANNKLLLRHELGHCNGWPGDHAGIRPYPRVKPGPPAGGHHGPVQPL